MANLRMHSCFGENAQTLFKNLTVPARRFFAGHAGIICSRKVTPSTNNLDKSGIFCGSYSLGKLRKIGQGRTRT